LAWRLFQLLIFRSRRTASARLENSSR
jgi:hypothetical protein